MKVSEIFYSIQGEGRYAGSPALFIRLFGCNFKCEFCDSKYALEKERYCEIEVEVLIDLASSYKHIVITGGEPLLQAKELEILLKSIPAKKEVESNGYFYKPELIGLAHFNISPKLDFFDSNYEEAIKKWNGKCDFKFVIRNYNDYIKVKQLEEKLGLENIFLMPEGVERETVIQRMKEVVEWAKKDKKNYIITSRLHIVMYGNERGK